MARAKCSTAMSGSPRYIRTHPLTCHAAANSDRALARDRSGRRRSQVGRNHREAESASIQRVRILPGEPYRLLGKSLGFGTLLGVVVHPAVVPSYGIAPGGHAVCRGEFGIELDRPVEQARDLPMASLS